MPSFTAASLHINIYIEEKWLYPCGREGCFDTLESMFPPAPARAGGTSFYGLRKGEEESAFQNDLMRRILPVKQEKNELSKKVQK